MKLPGFFKGFGLSPFSSWGAFFAYKGFSDLHFCLSLAVIKLPWPKVCFKGIRLWDIKKCLKKEKRENSVQDSLWNGPYSTPSPLPFVEPMVGDHSKSQQLG